ncbi:MULTISPECIES: DUF7057 domain-containing protein [Providencia]|uniref:DUF7057 domain-containing protein n=1 Tax=Providencia TaxID=586 RepID=UPI0008385EA6|nr:MULTISPECIES: DUF4153 domain-containing protein [Providencia]MBP6120922.1 DUF4153 domain-containing protein [Providencia sp.]NIH23465.1 DUF4153 domain-containing protein [Providencia heimbachae]
MGQPLQQESIRGYSYLIVVILSIIQGIVIYASMDYSIRVTSEFGPAFIYLPMMLAIYVPAIVSYLITDAKSLAFYINVFIAIALTAWVTIWNALGIEDAADASPVVAFATLTVLFFFLLPWMQMRQITGTWKIDYSCLMGFYIKNTFLGILACFIGGLPTAIIKLASFLFGIVNLEYLSNLLDSEMTYWVGFTLGFNISLVFLRSVLDIQLGNFASYIARFFLPLLNIVGAIFLVGFIISLVSGIQSAGLGSGVMLWFLTLNIVFINFVYGDGSNQYQFRSWLNSFVLTSIILLNAFSALSLYGILTRVHQYSWSIGRLYAFAIALFLALIVLAYTVAILRKRQRWMLSLGSINKVGLLGLITLILVINSPIANFKSITVNSILSGIEQGKIKIDSSLAYDLKSLGTQGKDAFNKLSQNPEYKTLLATSAYSEDKQKPLKEVLIQAKGSPQIPDSWFTLGNNNSNAWYCTSSYNPYDCLGFMADVNQDGTDEVVMCHSYPTSTSFECFIWQETTDSWTLADTQASSFESIEKRDEQWTKLLEGKFKLISKEWLQVSPN